MSKRKPEDDRRPGCRVIFLKSPDRYHQGIVLKRLNVSRQVTHEENKTPWHYELVYLVLFPRGELVQCGRRELEFQGQASVEELLTFHHHPDLIKIAMKRKAREERE
jgi:hypothetical protein